ncbi:hypothetical protein N7462_004172 [Penicillium macrosclerotiorum]|uniref:uncharacterized protein n=1 Tax=Penicillium macrosclerotiorum TaxID=303699 RepID=UPI002548E761|nr:uncharacterized protein N7462_004172 [Penicillium macrosclerotiorum]KAJ5689780.1 hypothetical protein N7462_004172 [Penicillium macrosclerotiorum]
MEPGNKRKLDLPPSAARSGNEVSPPPKKRLAGPAFPPSQSTGSEQNKDNRETGPSDSEHDSESDSDDDFGPSLPPPQGAPLPVEQPDNTPTSMTLQQPDAKKDSQRDHWMLHPPDQSDWASKIDPTQLRNRKFQSGKSARSSTSKHVDVSWMETPEERIKRLEDEVMGVGTSHSSKGRGIASTSSKIRAQSMEEKIKKFNDRTGKNIRLNDRAPPRNEEEDDPSKRAFDREKDMAASSKISNAQRREMMNKASGYSSRFTKGDFL